MEHQPKTEPGFDSTCQRNLEAMSIQELVSVLRTAFLTEDFNRVEEVLVSRYNKLQTEILHLQEKFELEKLIRFQADEDLRKREELCERGKRAQNNYETLLKEVKKTSLVDRNTIGELRKKNNELELEVCELRKLKKKWNDDSNVLAEPPNKRCKDAQGASSSSGVVMVNAKPSEEAKPKVDIKSNKQPNVDAKPVKDQPKVDTPNVDFRIQFTTQRKFDARTEMISWVRNIAYKLGFVAVIAKSDNGGNGRKGIVTIRCQRSGEYRKYIHKEREYMTTLICNCSFKLKSYLSSNGQWSLNVVDGEHNHKMTQHFQGHQYAEMLRPEEKGLVHEMTANIAHTIWVDVIKAVFEPANKRSKDGQGASSSSGSYDPCYNHRVTILLTVKSFLFTENGFNCSLRMTAQRDKIHMLEEVTVTDSVGVPPSGVQEQMVTQNKVKRKRFATYASSNSFDNFHFISLVHQERYSKFMANKKFVLERNIRLEGDEFSDIQAMIVARGWVELTSFAKEASATLAKEFFANAYQGPAKEDGNDKNDLMQFTSFVRGEMVPFHDKIINQLFGLENYEQCSFESRKAKGSNIDHQEIHSTLCKPEADWVRNKDGTPLKLRTSDLTSNAKAWATFVLHTLLPCSNVSDLTIQKAILLTAIIKGEPVNVGRLLADDLWSTANCSSPTSYINHASLISKLCERVKVYPEMNEEMVMPSGSITMKWIEKNSTASSKISVHPHK